MHWKNLIVFIRVAVDLKYLGDQENLLRMEQVGAHDDEIIQADLAQPVRTEQSVIDDIRLWGRGRSAAQTLLEAQWGGNFLSPQSPNPAARDILGLVAMLGRVESEDLNMYGANLSSHYRFHESLN